MQVGYLSQHSEHFGETGTVLEAAQRATRLTPNKARALLGQFLFSGEEAQKPIAGLSGGERQRLSLAILVHSGANVLILDEPTNHLDVESREALEEALEGFPGSVLLVSHDRALLDAVGSRTVAVEDGTLHSYDGGWADYLRMREERRALEEAAAGGRRGSGQGGSGDEVEAGANGAKPAATATASRLARRTRSAKRRGWSARSKRPRRRCRRWRRSWPIRPHGRIPSAPPTRPSATRRRSARSRSCTRATSASLNKWIALDLARASPLQTGGIL